MPTYEFRCPYCGHKIEELFLTHSSYDENKEWTCWKCSSTTTFKDSKIISSSSVVFGEGFNTPSSANMNGSVKMNKALRKR